MGRGGRFSTFGRIGLTAGIDGASGRKQPFGLVDITVELQGLAPKPLPHAIFGSHTKGSPSSRIGEPFALGEGCHEP